MKKNLTIDVSALPEEGKSYSGELDRCIFSFTGEDTQPAGPLEYDIHVQRFDTEVLIRGALSIQMRFICVRTLQPFLKTIRVEEFNTCLEMTGSQMDLTDALREETALLFPDYPRCDEADEPMNCEVDSRYLAVDKPTEDDVKTPPRDAAPTPWDALDAIEDNSDAGKS